MNRRSFFAALLFIMIVICAQGQNSSLKFFNISIKDGLSQSSPNCILQDSRGLMWIGTEDGLNKYDGYTFLVYKPEPENPYSISSSRVICLEEDPERNLWIGTNGGGLNRYDRSSDRFYTIDYNGTDSLIKGTETIRSLFYFGKNELWVGTDAGLFILDTEKQKYFNLSDLYPQLSIFRKISITVLASYKEIIWFGTTDGLYRFDTSRKSLIHYVNDPLDEETIPDNVISALHVSKDGQLIIGSLEGLSVLDPNSGSVNRLNLPERNSSSHADKAVKCILEDNEGNLWAGTNGNGLYIGSVTSGVFTNYTYDHLNPYSIKNNEVLSLFMDFSGLIWVGTNGIDVYNAKKEKFDLYDYVPFSSEKLIFRNIHPIYEDMFGVLWIGSKTDGLHILDRKNKKFSRLVYNPGSGKSLSSNKIRAIKEFPQGVLWVGTEDAGIDKVFLDENRIPVRIKNYRSIAGKTSGLTSNKIYSFFADDSGRLWIGTDNGLTIMNIEEEIFRQYLPDPKDTNSLSNTTVYAIYGDRNNNIWLATDFGVNLYNPVKDGFIRFVHDEKNENSIIHNEILCFHEDDKGCLWIGTYGKGFDKYDPKKKVFTHYGKIVKVSTAVIYGILEDGGNNLWMSTNNGIIRVNQKNKEYKVFDIEDGLQSNEFNGTSYFMNSSGEMFFGGQYGFNSFYPANVKIDTIAPKIVLSDLLVNNVSVVAGDRSPINKHINECREIILNHKQNNFTLYFSALHYANPLKNHYKYKLEGFDKEWIDAGNKRYVSYTNLPYKTYKFTVIASNSDGVWNKTGLTIKIRIKPPFWSTFSFRLVMLMIVAAAVYYYAKRRRTQNERQKKAIEEKFEASSRELQEAKNQLEKQHAEIVIQKRELLQRQKDQESLLWFNEGLGIFSELISKNRESLSQLCGEVIEKLVEYVDAQQGGIFLQTHEENDNPVLELIAQYAFSASRTGQKFNVGESYVGTCFKEKKFLEVDNLSENYSEFKSGLGQMYVKHLIVAPLIVNDECIGVLELGSFKKIKGYRVSFIEKLLETFASTITTQHANNNLKKLIEKSTRQAEELAISEEKMKENLKQLMIAQEETSKREDELIKMAEESATREEMLTMEIEKLKQQLEDKKN